MVTGTLNVPVIRGTFLTPIDRADRAVRVKNDLIQGVYPAQPIIVHVPMSVGGLITTAICDLRLFSAWGTGLLLIATPYGANMIWA